MATVPGFSVSELIQAVGHIKTIYDAFFSKYSNSASQVRDLADHIQQFQTNLQDHKKAIESRGLEYSGYVAIKRTLEECEDFLEKYKAVLEKKNSVVKVWRTGRFQYEKDIVARLQKQIESHGINILHFNMNLLLQDALQRENTITPTNVSQALDIPAHSSHNLVPIPLPPPLLPENRRILEGSRLSLSLGDGSPKSPKWNPGYSGSGSWSGQDSLQGSPQSPNNTQQFPSEVRIQRQSSDVVLQPPRDYCVATLYIGENDTELRRKPMGRNLPLARELLIFDEKGGPRLRHQIKLRPRQSCYPYTWHRRWKKKCLEVTFKEPFSKSHSVKFYDQIAGSDVPQYVFTKHDDYKEFQSQVRDKELIDYFNFDQIGTASSKKEATDQHLKIWRDRTTQDHSISFYASVAQKPSDLEFPISMFEQEITSEDGIQLTLDFLITKEVKNRLSKKRSRSSTVRSSSSISSYATSVFSQRPTPIHQMTMTTVADSGMSVISTSSENSQTQTGEAKSGLSSIEARAKKMEYINIEFSDDDEADRFREVYGKAYKEEASRPSDFVVNWQIGAHSSQRSESVISNMSPAATPFTMSPELRGQVSPVLQPQQ